MKIDQTKNNPLFRNSFEKAPVPKGDKTVPVENNVKAGDKIEISAEAKMLINNNIAPRDVQSIKEKIKNNFYNSDEVTRKVADAIMKDLVNSPSDNENGEAS